MFRLSDRIVWQCYDFVYHFEWLTCTSVATSLIWSSVLTVFWLTGLHIIFQAVSLLCKMYAPLKHATTVQGFFAVPLLVHQKHFASGFPYFLAELDIFLLLKVLDFRRSQTTTLDNSDFLSKYTTHKLLLAGMRKEWRLRHLVAPCTCCGA
jgi:hypothetical protein